MNRLRVLFCDHLSLARGKYLSGGKRAGGESRLCQGTYAVTYCKDLIPTPGGSLLDGLNDLVLRFDDAEARASWQADTDVVIADQFFDHGAPLDMCGRGLLKRTVSAWQQKGLTPKVGIELEAFAFELDEDGKLQPYDTPGAYVYGTGSMIDPLGFTDDIWARAVELGFPLESLTSEFDSPQFEFTLTYEDAVKAVDDMFLFRLLAREVALEHGILLTFMPKPIAELGGSGLHVNFSFVDENGENVILDAAAEYGLSDVARGAVAGLMHHHRGMAGLIAPTVNSYQRLQPASLSGFWRNWGFDHRGVTVRIANESKASARIEHRMGDAASNPYTLVSTVLQCALLGVENDYELAAPESQDCLEGQDTDISVPPNLSEALDALEADSVLVDAVGELLVANHIGIKRAEVEKLEGLDDTAARDYYIYYV
ncbi:MAG: glutamine synthetase [Thiotrichales bacterium]|nr:glutamine synthetase [Thiotrichales bacterium]|tara:strand:- start:564 stop:1844 length:1281 start_codon:yes stop_codon:yes gene_type:complete